MKANHLKATWCRGFALLALLAGGACAAADAPPPAPASAWGDPVALPSEAMPLPSRSQLLGLASEGCLVVWCWLYVPLA